MEYLFLCNTICIIFSIILLFYNRKQKQNFTNRFLSYVCMANIFVCLVLNLIFINAVLSKVGKVLFPAGFLMIMILWTIYTYKFKKDIISHCIAFLPLIAFIAFGCIFYETVLLLPYSTLLSILIFFINEQNARLTTDSLTRLPNRYGLDAEIEEQLEQYEKDKTDSFYVIVCDMDNFKHINDTWGHLEGDRALKMISETLTRVAKDFNSTAFRFGGDEFVIITDKSDDGLGEEICEKVKNELDKLNFRDDFAIRMSMGVALYDGTKTISELIEGADRELYEEKKQKN